MLVLVSLHFDYMIRFNNLKDGECCLSIWTIKLSLDAWSLEPTVTADFDSEAFPLAINHAQEMNEKKYRKGSIISEIDLATSGLWIIRVYPQQRAVWNNARYSLYLKFSVHLQVFCWLGDQ